MGVLTIFRPDKMNFKKSRYIDTQKSQRYYEIKRGQEN
jgi:hypothetical protein